MIEPMVVAHFDYPLKVLFENARFLLQKAQIDITLSMSVCLGTKLQCRIPIKEMQGSCFEVIWPNFQIITLT